MAILNRVPDIVGHRYPQNSKFNCGGILLMHHSRYQLIKVDRAKPGTGWV